MCKVHYIINMQHCRSIKKIPTRYLSRTSPPQHTHIPFQNVRTPHRTSKPLTTVSPTHPSKPLLLLQTHLQSDFSARRAAAHPQRTHSISLPLSLSLSLSVLAYVHTRARADILSSIIPKSNIGHSPVGF